ncbi:MAG: DNA polymerase III subunit alpha, partial [Pseudomonadota bacterium]
DDSKTYAMLCKAESVGVFQLESAGMRDVLRKLKPDRFDDLIAVVALFRPGPMENIPTYIRRKHGQEKVEYLHPALETVLGDTYGIAIYQEQVMQMAQLLAGYTFGGADLLRRAMGKKIKAEMDAQREVFVKGSLKTQNIKKTLADRIFDEIAAFAGYGFNKCHATPYALLSYQTAWLRANHPVAFYAATLTYDQQNTDRLGTIYRAMQTHCVVMLPPDINASESRFVPEELPDGSFAVRYGLGAVKNLGSNAIEAIVQTRANEGSFQDIYDFLARVDAKVMSRRSWEALIMAGAFDHLHDNRRQLYESVDIIIQHGQVIHAERNSQQVSLFGADMVKDQDMITLAPIQDWGRLDRLNNEQRAIGFYLSAHPLDGMVADAGIALKT